MIPFHFFSANQRNQYIATRMGEEKLGEAIQIVDSIKALENTECKFVIIGASEDIGIRGNGGLGGADSAWESFLKSFINIQHNAFLDSTQVVILGHFTNREPAVYDEVYVKELDEALSTMVSEIISLGKTPILIGGGHNNAYGMLKGISTAYKQAVNVINLDPHADLRSTESRHSGNGFSFARKEGYLHKYALLGLQEAYNNTFILDQLKDTAQHHAVFFEDIFMRNKIDWESAMAACMEYVNDDKFGVELDLDAIGNTLSSAMTPLGIDARMAYRYLYLAGQEANCAYLHLAEAIAVRADGLEQPSIGKLLSFLVQAFIKGKVERTA